MRYQVHDHISFGDEVECSNHPDSQFAVVHACKDPCHRRAVGYSEKSLPNSHPNYLVLEQGTHLYLNLIDPPAPLFMPPSFEAFMSFLDRHIPTRHVLIHCNKGESRAPSLALLYAAKRLGLFPSDSYANASLAFRHRFPAYNPGRGIQTWLTQNWGKIA